MESIQTWAAERGHIIEPYGVDLSPGLVALARRRLPSWANRIEVGNAINYNPGRRFTFVHLLLDQVPTARRRDLLTHALDTLVEPAGRLLVSHYVSRSSTDHSAAEHLTRLDFPISGTLETTAWIDR